MTLAAKMGAALRRLGVFVFTSAALGVSAFSQNIPVPNGPGYLFSDGRTLSWSSIQTGGSGALDCVSIAATCDVVTALVPLKATANAWSGANDFGGAAFLRLPGGAGAPPASACAKLTDVGKAYVRNDAKATNASFYVCAQTSDRIFAWEVPGGGPAAAPAVRAEALPAYTADGKEVSLHRVAGQARFAGLTAKLHFRGPAAFAASSSYSCRVTDFAGTGIATQIVEKSGSSVTLLASAATPNRAFEFDCVGR